MATKGTSSSLTTPQVEALLAERFAPPEYATLFNVKNRTGYSSGGADRFCDALAMNLYPSRGLEVLGFEVKVSRSDWMRELKEPAKAEAIARYCDRWYLVVGDPDIVKPGELPPTWGLLVPSRGTLVIKTEAPKLEAKDLDRPFIAAMLRRATETSPAQVAEAERRGYERGFKKGEERGNMATEDLQRQLQRSSERFQDLQRQVHQFEQTAGISISGWGVKARIGEVTRLALEGRFDLEIRRVREQLRALLAAADESVAALEQLHAEPPEPAAAGEGAPQ